MKPLEQHDVLRQVLAWRALTIVSALLLGMVVSGLSGQDGRLGGYMTADALLTLALRPVVSHLGPHALSVHMALAVSWMTGVFFVAQLL